MGMESEDIGGVCGRGDNKSIEQKVRVELERSSAK